MDSSASAGLGEYLASVQQMAEKVARPAAAAVDRDARFPKESVQALRVLGALGDAVPRELGGRGADLETLALTCRALGRHCASSAMVLAMHHIQVLSIAHHHGGRPELADYLRRVAAEQRLIASVTSEVGPGGDMRASVAAIHHQGDSVEVTKQATTISYGAHADDLLLTARRDPDATPGEQVLVLLIQGDYALREPGSWDTLGMRGTCSSGATVEARARTWQVLPEPFSQIATCTMVPTSHVLWAGCWLGIATDAVSTARGMVRARARKEAGRLPAGAQRLADVAVKLELMQNEVLSLAREYDQLRRHCSDVHAFQDFGFGLRVNNLKLAASTLVVEIVGEAIQICGISAYKNDSPHSLGRHLRDAHSAALMVSNDRLRDTNASLLMVRKGD
jgi:acyl-CoA dehydrogenase